MNPLATQNALLQKCCTEAVVLHLAEHAAPCHVMFWISAILQKGGIVAGIVV
jgi:hypothetical protein